MRLILAAFALIVAFGAVYLPDLGHGFIKDDFGWIAGSRLDSVAELPELFARNVGFYRPLVSATFSLDHAVWGLHPFGYGLTNLLLFGLVAVLLYRLARVLGLPPGPALLAVAIWAFNFHSVRMALLWISGRTALMLSVLALGSAIAVLRRRHVVAGVLCLLAMLCKEEAVLLPMVFAAFLWWDGPDHDTWGARRALTIVWPCWIAIAVYAVLRINSGAFGPTDAPSYYQLSWNPLVALGNVVQYLDRAATVAAAAGIIFTLGSRPWRPLLAAERRVIAFGLVWLAGLYGITIFLPIRSDLYALAPSMGAALAAGALGAAALRAAPARFSQISTALILIVFALIPVYRQRHVRWVAPADLSAAVMQTLQQWTPARDRGHVILVDDPDVRFNLDSAFGTLLPDAVRLLRGDGWTAEVRGERDPACPSPDTGLSAPDIFVLTGGQLTPCPQTPAREEQP